MNKFNTKNNLYGSSAAFYCGAIYVLVFALYASVLNSPQANDAESILNFLKEKHSILFAVNIFGYVGFGVAIAILSLVLQLRLQSDDDSGNAMLKLAGIFALIWVGLVIASGSISNHANNRVIQLAATSTEQAFSLLRASQVVVSGIGGNNEFVGGMWVLLVSMVALKTRQWHRHFSHFGLFVGLVGIITLLPVKELTEVFGVSQIVWFFGLAYFLLKESKQHGNRIDIDKQKNYVA